MDSASEGWESGFKQADAALYAAKAAGRSRVQTADAETSPMNSKKLYMTIIDDDEVMRALLAESLKEAFGSRFELVVESYRDGTSYFGQRVNRIGRTGGRTRPRRDGIPGQAVCTEFIVPGFARRFWQ